MIVCCKCITLVRMSALQNMPIPLQQVLVLSAVKAYKCAWVTSVVAGATDVSLPVPVHARCKGTTRLHLDHLWTAALD